MVMSMKTKHKIIFDDSKNMEIIPSDSIDPTFALKIKKASLIKLAFFKNQSDQIVLFF